MNIKKFKRIVNTWESSEENFRFFRTWVENHYISYEKNYKFEIEKINQYPVDSSKINELENGWKNIAYTDVVAMYSKIGWKLDEKIGEIEMSHYNELDSSYYGVAFPNIYEKIKTISDDIEFAYAVMSVVKNVDVNCKLYTQFVIDLHNGLKEYDLLAVKDMIEKEQKQNVFIAMSFDESMSVARKAIKDAVQSCGYIPMLIDVKEHNNQIVPEIYKEINNSKFVIADLTGQRGGVYYEAGYAVAKNKELILCCKEGENPHFDVAQINTVFWKNEQDLRGRLIKRIEATVGKDI